MVDAFAPACNASSGVSAFGPSVEADLMITPASGEPEPAHMIRTVAGLAGPFVPYNRAGQNPTGANAHIEATYVGFNPRYEGTFAGMRPWSAGASGAGGGASRA